MISLIYVVLNYCTKLINGLSSNRLTPTAAQDLKSIPKIPNDEKWYCEYFQLKGIVKIYLLYRVRQCVSQQKNKCKGVFNQ